MKRSLSSGRRCRENSSDHSDVVRVKYQDHSLRKDIARELLHREHETTEKFSAKNVFPKISGLVLCSLVLTHRIFQPVKTHFVAREIIFWAPKNYIRGYSFSCFSPAALASSDIAIAVRNMARYLETGGQENDSHGQPLLSAREGVILLRVIESRRARENRFSTVPFLIENTIPTLSKKDFRAVIPAIRKEDIQFNLDTVCHQYLLSGSINDKNVFLRKQIQFASKTRLQKSM